MSVKPKRPPQSHFCGTEDEASVNEASGTEEDTSELGPSPKPANDSSGPDNDAPGIENEFVWAIRPFLRRCVIILSCWTMPFAERPSVETFTRNDGVSARAFALFLIAALTFAVRGEAGGPNRTEIFTAFSAGIAVILSAVLNLISRAYGIRDIRERLIISAYASTIIVMFLFVIFQQVLIVTDDSLLSLLWNTGDVVVPATFAGLTTFVLLVVKSAIWDKHRINVAGIRHGSVLTAGSTIIVIVIALMSSRLFNELVEWLSKLHSSS